MLHTITNSELTYGFIKDKNIFQGFGLDYSFVGAQIEYLSGDILTCYSHNRGDYHTHRSISGRVDGFKDAFDRMSSNLIDVKVNNDAIYIKEIWI